MKMQKLKTDISVYCTCGERLYGPGSWTDFSEDSNGNLGITLHTTPCSKCGETPTHRSSVKKEFVRGRDGWSETVKING